MTPNWVGDEMIVVVGSEFLKVATTLKQKKNNKQNFCPGSQSSYHAAFACLIEQQDQFSGLAFFVENFIFQKNIKWAVGWQGLAQCIRLSFFLCVCVASRLGKGLRHGVSRIISRARSPWAV